MVNWKLRTWQTCGVEENYVEWFICLWYVVIYHRNRYVLHPLSKIKYQHWVITQWSEVSRCCVTILKTILHCGDKVSRPSSQNGEIGHAPFLHPLNHRLYKTLQRKSKFRNDFNIVTVSSYITIIYHINKFNNKTDTHFQQSLLPPLCPQSFEQFLTTVALSHNITLYIIATLLLKIVALYPTIWIYVTLWLYFIAHNFFLTERQKQVPPYGSLFLPLNKN